MIKNPAYKTNVMMDEEKSPGMRSPRNMYAVDNVNVAQGPRMGNDGSIAKRKSFVAQKQERAPIADMITSAFAARDPKDHIQKNLEGIESDVPPRRLKRATY